MTSILIPIARYPWFCNAVMHNLRETVTDRDQVDVVFVTSKEVDAPLAERLGQQDGFRWLRSPHQRANAHHDLLDWAMHHGDLHDVVIVQHCDCFHRQGGWLDHVVEVMTGDVVALQSPRGPQFWIGGRVVQAQHDYLGCVRRSHFVENRLTYRWGMLKDIASPELLEKIDAKRIKRVDRDKWLDGAATLGLEFGVRWPKQVAPFVWHDHLHVWQVFRWGARMKRHEDTIFIRSRPQCPFPLAVYSLLSSFYFDRNDPYVLPWALASQHFDGWKNRQYSQAYWLLDQLGEWHEDCCGADDDLGLALDWTGEDDLIRFEDV